MQKKDLIQMLHDVDENTAVNIGEQYSGIPDADHERIFQRIEERLQTDTDAQVETFTIGHAPRFSWMQYAYTAAACVLVLFGTFAGMFVLKAHMPPSEQEDPPLLVHETGDLYAVGNLTQHGKLLLTVEDFEMTQDGLYHVSITLESENAASHVPEQPNMFMADNFMLAVGQDGSLWKAVQACKIETDGEQNAHPYMFTLHSGETRLLELWYKMDSEPSECYLVTSYSTEHPYTELIDKEK